MDQTEILPEKTAQRIKIIFLAWGYSIHAQRRIRIFTDDPAFDVTVVSTYNYQFPGASTIPLCRAKFPENSGVPDHGGILYPFVLTGRFIRELIYLVKDYRILKKAVDEKEPDVIFLQTLLYPGYLWLLIRKPIPSIITFWNGDVTWWAKWTGIERLVKKQIVTRGVRRASSITVNSEEALKACMRYGKPAEAVHIIRYPGIDLSRFYPIDKEQAKVRIGVTARKIVFWPRGMADYLNFDTLIAASRIVLRRYADIRFVILFANKNIDPSIAEGLRKDGLDKNYLLLDKIAFEEMPFYYSAADMMISISSNDSLPNTMLEAMACGCPVIMGDIPQIREWVRDNQNGYLCPVKDTEKLAECILKVIENPKNLNETFTQENISRIQREVDSQKMSELIKQLAMKNALKKPEDQQ